MLEKTITAIQNLDESARAAQEALERVLSKDDDEPIRVAPHVNTWDHKMRRK